MWATVAPGVLSSRILVRLDLPPQGVLIERPARRSPATARRRLRGGAARCPGFRVLRAHAFKPYTHIQSGTAGVGGRDRRRQGHDRRPRRTRCKPEVVAALRDHPRVLQRRRRRSRRLPGSHVRPVGGASRADTGKWLTHILKQAYEAQSDPTYSAAETQPDPRLRLRLPDPRGRRHVGAHAGQRRLRRRLPGRRRDPHGRRRRRDRDPPPDRRGLHRRRHGRLRRQQGARARCPARSTRTATRRSPTTPRRTSPFAAPKRFIYETFINPDNPLPVGTSRGPLIDFFLDMQAELQVSEARYAWDSEYEDCLILDPDCYERTKTLDGRDRARPEDHADRLQPLRGRFLLRRSIRATSRPT